MPCDTTPREVHRRCKRAKDASVASRIQANKQTSKPRPLFPVRVVTGSNMALANVRAYVDVAAADERSTLLTQLTALGAKVPH